MTIPTTAAPLYRNPIIDADVPDPDAIRVGDDYFLVCSSFNRAPGLPVYTSRDLVGWRRIAHALPANEPDAWFALPRHGGGVWAPSIRFHDGRFHIVYPDPDQGIFVVSATDPSGPWSTPRLLLAGLGLIDPCPLWDDDGRAYLVHGWAGSRAGRKNILTVVPVDPALTGALGPGVDVIDGDALPGYRTLEGPKFYKRDGWYWIFAPAGGVQEGWQSVFRARSPFGPYEDRIVLEQGSSPVNGPHQGAWVDTVDGGHWFLHFQDRGPFGRVLHLQPMAWAEDGWPVMGAAVAGGPPEPVVEHPTPFGTAQGARTLTVSDAFDAGEPGDQWVWQANPDPAWVAETSGGLALRGVANDTGNLRSLPQVLGQPLPGLASVSRTSVALDGPDGARAGLVVLGRGYLWAGIRVSSGGMRRIVVASRADGGTSETTLYDEPLDEPEARLRVSTAADAAVSVAVGLGDGWHDLGEVFTAAAGHWIGAEIGLFAAAPLGAGVCADARFGAFAITVDDERSDDGGKA